MPFSVLSTLPLSSIQDPTQLVVAFEALPSARANDDDSSPIHVSSLRPLPLPLDVGIVIITPWRSHLLS
jgi:hypothetical protein